MSFIENNLKESSILALLFAGLLVTAPASAANACDNAYTQTDINKCMAAELSVEDGKLNRSYSDLQRLLNANEKKQLKTAQRAWIDFRDKACKFSARSFSGGSAYSMASNSCLATYTQQRRMQLEEEIKNIKR